MHNNIATTAVTTAVTGDFRLVKNGTAATLSGATVTHDANGYYTIALTTGDTDTVGRLDIGVGNTAMSMAMHRHSVVLAGVFDTLITNGFGDLANTILSRNVSNVETTMPEHCLGTIVLALLEHAISGTTLTIRGTDGSTTRFTKTLTTNAAADPITGIQ